MADDIVEKIKQCVLVTKLSMGAPAAEAAVEDAEAALGFTIPSLLKSLYLNVGNGGFGPGYGIIGMAGGHASDLGTLVETYNEIQKGAVYLGLNWQPGLLPFCGWGCNIFSCVDCTDENHGICTSEECHVRSERYRLDDFFLMWLNGVDILNCDGSPRETAEIINPFTRKKTRVHGARKKEK